tara:strand:- start:62 stop:808 length:747 start_codon:yes stop_codon:yes gene_type:complete
MQNKLLKEYFTPQELKKMGVDPFAMGDVSSFQRKQTIAPPTAKPKNLSSLVLDYAEQSPTALRVSGGDPLKNLINFAADYVPGLSLEKAKREQDVLGQKLAVLDLIPSGGLLAKKGAQITKSEFKKLANKGKINIARNQEESLKALLEKKSPAQNFEINEYDDLAMDYETGKFTKSLKDKGFYVIDDKMGNVVAGQTKKDAENLLKASSPYEYGKSYGYSDEDIAQFYVNRKGGDLDAGYEQYINDIK